MTRILALAAMAAVLAGSQAMADETVATASPADIHPPGANAPAPGPLGAGSSWRSGGGDVLMTACGPEAVNDQGAPVLAPHGEVSVGVGTRGYREVSGSVCQPLPGGGFVAVSGGSSHISR